VTDVAEQNYADALAKARGEFAKGDPLLMADCSGAGYEDLGEGSGLFTLTYLNKSYQITYPAGMISFASSGGGKVEASAEKAGCGRPSPHGTPVDYSGSTILISDQTLMLMYLKQASGLPSRGQWLNFLQLPEGSHHYGPFIIDAINPLVVMFDGQRELFYRVLAEIGGEQAKLGDFGGLVPVFPRIKLAIVIWEGDEEFPAKGNMLFDANVPTYLDTAGAYVMGINAARRLVAAGAKLQG
jgi:hypothetical protein